MSTLPLDILPAGLRLSTVTPTQLSTATTDVAGLPDGCHARRVQHFLS